MRVWSGGEGRGRVALPSSDGERTLVSDGTTRWSYDSRDRTATRAPAGEGPGQERADNQDPTTAATQAIATLRQSSTVAVDGTAEVAGRAAYQLVLTPLPTERTLLREVRVAVDAETRQPLQLTVLAQGSGEPALQVGFSEIAYGPQDASLSPSPRRPARPSRTRRPMRAVRTPRGRPAGPAGRRRLGHGDRGPRRRPARPAAEGQQPEGQQPEGAPDLSALGTPVSGPRAPDA